MLLDITPPVAAAKAPRNLLGRLALNALGLSLGGDLHEWATDLGLALPLSPARRRRFEAVRRAGILFVHVPKCAGMAVSEALYGSQIKHGTVRWYRRYAPHLDDLPSFAVLRDPVERFVSAWRYARTGGSPDNRVSAPFRDRYMGLRSLDHAIDHVEQATSVYRIDHIFRPQHWYVTDANGAVDVDLLFELGDPALERFIRTRTRRGLPRVNRSRAPRPRVTSMQEERIRWLYRADALLLAQAGSVRPSFVVYPSIERALEA